MKMDKDGSYNAQTLGDLHVPSRYFPDKCPITFRANVHEANAFATKLRDMVSGRLVGFRVAATRDINAYKHLRH